MKVRVRLRAKDQTLEGTFTGANAEQVVGAIQREAANRAGLLVRMAILALSPLAFAREAVRLHNEQSGARHPLPNSCAEFLQAAIGAGLAEMLET